MTEILKGTIKYVKVVATPGTEDEIQMMFVPDGHNNSKAQLINRQVLFDFYELQKLEEQQTFLHIEVKPLGFTTTGKSKYLIIKFTKI